MYEKIRSSQVVLIKPTGTTDEMAQASDRAERMSDGEWRRTAGADGREERWTGAT